MFPAHELATRDTPRTRCCSRKPNTIPKIGRKAIPRAACTLLKEVAVAQHERLMCIALEEAALAAAEGEIPVGAVIVRAGEVIARAHNRREQGHDPTAHAEMLAIREASQTLGTRRLEDCTLYTTLEPCPMCAGAMVMAKLGECYFGAYDDRQGCCQSVYALASDPAFYWRLRCMGGVLKEEAQALLTTFFQARRDTPAAAPTDE